MKRIPCLLLQLALLLLFLNGCLFSNNDSKDEPLISEKESSSDIDSSKEALSSESISSEASSDENTMSESVTDEGSSQESSSENEGSSEQEVKSGPQLLAAKQLAKSDENPGTLPEIPIPNHTDIATLIQDSIDTQTGAMITFYPVDTGDDGAMGDIAWGSGGGDAAAGGGVGGGTGGAGVAASSGGEALVIGDEKIIYIEDDDYLTDEDPNNTVAARQLTAAEWYDHAHWPEFREFLYTYPEYYEEWELNVQKRVMIAIHDTVGVGIPDSKVVISKGFGVYFEGRTTAEGIVAFFPRIENQDITDFTIDITTESSRYRSIFTISPDDDQLWKVTVPEAYKATEPALDIVFTVDVTGSMGDELDYLKAELLNITHKIMQQHSAGIRVGLMFYKDRGDDFVTKGWDLTDDLTEVQENLEVMVYGGGGDTPESVNQALHESIESMSWQENNAVRLNFLIADAPPNVYEDEQYTYIEATRAAAQKGIKIIPVAASGIDRSTEYLFRSIAVATMGKYIYLTDHSGIGGTHLEAEVSDMTVETLNQILTRTIEEELSFWPGMDIN